MLPRYQDLLSGRFSCLAENPGPYLDLTERHIQAAWLEQKYFSPLLTPTGERIEVLSPGIWNTEAGPDFLKAHLRIGQLDWKGDIEVHLTEEGWLQHGHHQDERYNEVILHVVLWQPRQPRLLLTCEGKAIKTIYLEHQLTISLPQLIQSIDIELYPYQKWGGSGRCAQRLFQTLSEEEVRSFFISASYWRLDQKKLRLQQISHELSLQAAAGIAIALGYKHNAEAFVDLFQFLLPYRDLPEEELLSIALGCCGFFEEKARWHESSYYQHLLTLWWGRRDQMLHQSQLRLDRIRPLNHPIRRLVYLVKLLQDPQTDDLGKQIQQVCHHLDSEEACQSLIDCIPVYRDAYWNSHYTFEQHPREAFLPLIGNDLKAAILINTLLPLAYAEIKDDVQAKQLFQLFYQKIKAFQIGKSQYLTHRFFGNTTRTSMLKLAQIEQGTYQLHKDFCIHFEASCEGCPFVEKYLDLR